MSSDHRPHAHRRRGRLLRAGRGAGRGDRCRSGRVGGRRGGLVTATRDGKLVRYRADPATIGARLNELHGYLACCCPPPAQATQITQ